MKNTTHLPNYKKIGSKLWSWQCARFYDKYGVHDVINYVNELKLKRTQLDIWETICDKFHWNQPSSFGVLAQTVTQKTVFFLNWTSTIHSVNEIIEWATYHAVGLEWLPARGHALLLDGGQHVADVLRQLDARPPLPPRPPGGTLFCCAVGGPSAAVPAKVLRDVKARVVGHAGGVQVVCVFILLPWLCLLYTPPMC